MSQLSTCEIENYRVERLVLHEGLIATSNYLRYLLEYLVGLKKSE